jgi:signal transduction histidine kinase
MWPPGEPGHAPNPWQVDGIGQSWLATITPAWRAGSADRAAWADSAGITRILGNLLDNAATHAPPGSPIRLTGGREGTKVVLAVQDDGPGIPPEARDRIFERYVQLDRDGRPASGGLGLGLYIARRLTHANSGELVCTDPPGGRGACFELRLPIARPAQDRNPQAPPSGASGKER